MKTCIKCKIKKPESEFYQRKDRRNSYNTCKGCWVEYTTARYDKMRREDRTAYFRNQNMKRKYGITLVEYKKILADQFLCCACCGDSWLDDESSINWPVDHNHETGKVRGIVCPPCNWMLGWARDTVERLESGIKYLQKWGE